MFLADTLSKAHLPVVRPTSQDEFEQVNMAQYLPISEPRLREIKDATEHDEVLQVLKRVILQGWPDEKHDLPTSVIPFFSFREELTTQDGLIFKGNRVVIPNALRQLMKEKIHSSHMGIDSCLRRARECMYWPNMSTDMTDYISRCATCRELETASKRETLMPHDVPDRPWANIGTDLFTCNNKEYLVTVDYFSNFFEVDELPNTQSKTVVACLKRHFARYGYPEVLVSDNGPQYTSSEFAAFSLQWDFEHCTSSPGHSQANGKAESVVKTAKTILRKTAMSGGDFSMALLDLRNTSTAGMSTSPT